MNDEPITSGTVDVTVEIAGLLMFKLWHYNFCGSRLWKRDESWLLLLFWCASGTNPSHQYGKCVRVRLYIFTLFGMVCLVAFSFGLLSFPGAFMTTLEGRTMAQAYFREETRWLRPRRLTKLETASDWFAM